MTGHALLRFAFAEFFWMLNRPVHRYCGLYQLEHSSVPVTAGWPAMNSTSCIPHFSLTASVPLCLLFLRTVQEIPVSINKMEWACNRLPGGAMHCFHVVRTQYLHGLSINQYRPRFQGITRLTCVGEYTIQWCPSRVGTTIWRHIHL